MPKNILQDPQHFLIKILTLAPPAALATFPPKNISTFSSTFVC